MCPFICNFLREIDFSCAASVCMLLSQTLFDIFLSVQLETVAQIREAFERFSSTRSLDLYATSSFGQK